MMNSAGSHRLIMIRAAKKAGQARVTTKATGRYMIATKIATNGACGPGVDRVNSARVPDRVMDRASRFVYDRRSLMAVGSAQCYPLPASNGSLCLDRTGEWVGGSVPLAAPELAA